jgi:hypothetical protein
MSYRSAVKQPRHWLWVGFCGVMLSAVVHAEVAEANPPGDPAQHVFLARNPFGLKPAPPVTAPSLTPTNPLVKVDLKLAGITVDNSGKRAWLVVPPSPGRGATPAVTNQTYFSIAEGGRQGEVEVLAIDPKANTVRILNAGAEVTLDFANNGLAAPPPLAGSHGGAAGLPRVIPTAGAPAPGMPTPGMPGASPALKSAAFNPGGAMPMPAGYGGAGQGNPVVSAAPADTTIAGRNSPTRNVRTSPEAPVAVDPATQIILMRAQEARERAAGRPFPPLPPMPGLPPSQE